MSKKIFMLAATQRRSRDDRNKEHHLNAFLLHAMCLWQLSHGRNSFRFVESYSCTFVCARDHGI